MATVGAVISVVYVLDNVLETVLPFDAASAATPAATLTVTIPAAKGVMFTVYVVPLPAKVPAVPLLTVMSPITNPVTTSLKVMVTGMGDTFVGSEAVVVMATVGAV